MKNFMKKLISFSIRVLKYGFALLLIFTAFLISFAIFIAKTDTGRAVLTSSVEALSSRTQIPIVLGKLDGSIFSSSHIDYIALKHKDNIFLEVKNLSLDWDFWSLFQKKLNVKVVSAEAINLKEVPEFEKTGKKSSKPSDFIDDLKSFFQSETEINIEKVQVKNIVIEENIVHDPISLTLNASLVAQKNLLLSLDIRRTDHIKGFLLSSLSYAVNTSILDVSINFFDDKEGFLSSVFNNQELKHIEGKFKGIGPIQNWLGTLSVSNAEDRIVSGSLALKKVDEVSYHFGTLLEVSLMSLAPDDHLEFWKEPILYRNETFYTIPSNKGTLSSRKAAHIKSLSSFEKGKSHFSSVIETYLGQNKISGYANGFIDQSDAFLPLLPEDVSWKSVDIKSNYSIVGDDSNILSSIIINEPKWKHYQSEKAHVDLKVSDLLNVADPSLVFQSTFYKLKNDGYVGTSAPGNMELRASGAWSLDKKYLELPDILLRYKGIELKGISSVSKKNVNLSLQIPDTDLHSLEPLFDEKISGKIIGFMKVEHKISDSNSLLNVDLETKDLRIPGLANYSQYIENALLKVNAYGYANLKDTVVELTDLKALYQTAALNLSVSKDNLSSSKETPLTGVLNVTDLSSFSKNLKGNIHGKFSLLSPYWSKSNDPSHSGQFLFSIPELVINDQKLKDIKFTGDFLDNSDKREGNIVVSGNVDETPFSGKLLAKQTSTGDYQISLEPFRFRSALLQGEAHVNSNHIMNGSFHIQSEALDDFTFLAGSPLSGQADLQVQLKEDSKKQSVLISGTLNNLQFSDNALSKGVVDLSVADLYQKPLPEGKITLEGVKAGQLVYNEITVTSQKQEEKALIKVAALSNQMKLHGQWSLFFEKLNEGILSFKELSLNFKGQTFQLTKPFQLIWNEGQIKSEKAQFLMGKGGHLEIQGDVLKDNLSASLDAKNVPLSFLNAFSPNMTHSGMFNGFVTVSGKNGSLNGSYKLSVSNYQLLQGDDKRSIKLNSIISEGIIENNKVRTTSVLGREPYATYITGTVPLAQDKPLSVFLKGKLNLHEANSFFDEQVINGIALIDLSVDGNMKSPKIDGKVQLNKASFTDRISGIRLSNINLEMVGNQDQLVLNNFSAATRQKGHINGSGSIKLDPAAHFPGNFNIKGKKALLVDTDDYKISADFNLNISGSLGQAPHIQGNITSQLIDIAIPDTLPLSFTAIPVRHEEAPPHILKRLKERQKEEQEEEKTSAFNATLNIIFSVGDRIFVHGRGVYADLKGKVHILGSTQEPVFNGRFDLRRGTLQLLGRKLTFKKGEIDLVSSRIPQINFIAETESDGVRLYVTVSGSVLHPIFSFSSQPSLPQDEIFSRVIFGKPSGSLSAGQAIQLAQTLSQLNGGTNLRLLDNLAQSLGLDSVSISSDDKGHLGLEVGKRINDNVYMGFQQGSGEMPNKIKLDIEVIKNLKLQGEVGDDGSTAAGVGMEWDY